MPINFYDSVNPAAIPAGRVNACLYYDGDYAATPADAGRFAAVRWITVEADFVHCGIIDYEPGNPAYEIDGILRYYVEQRTKAGHRARVYADMDNYARAAVLLEGLEFEWWLATLNGNQLDQHYVPRLWAVQYQGGPKATYDTSVLYGEW
jgi:hypothetical protein